MNAAGSIDLMSRIRELVARDTGTHLSAEGEAQLAGLVARALPAAALGAEPRAEPREVTILLADLRGFTALTAMQPAGVVIAILNRCLGRMSEIVFRYGGTIDKFMGDAIMVLFGVPHAHMDDVERALACAAGMQIAMCGLNAEFRAESLPELHMGIGINTGVVMAGRFGSQAYSEYTVIGDEVNLTSRIEAFSLRGQVLISESSYARCAAQIVASEAMEVQVKGKPEPVRMRELIALPSRGLLVPRQEARRSHRVEVRLPCRVQGIRNKIVMPPVRCGWIRDIGYHGVQLEMDSPVDLRSELKLEFDLDLVEHRLTDLYARAVNLKASGERWLIGLEFTSIDSLSNAKIQMFVQLLVSSR